MENKIVFKELMENILNEEKGDGIRKKLIKLLPDYIKLKKEIFKTEAKYVKEINKKFGIKFGIDDYLNDEIELEIKQYVEKNYPKHIQNGKDLYYLSEIISEHMYKLSNLFYGRYDELQDKNRHWSLDQKMLDFLKKEIEK